MDQKRLSRSDVGALLNTDRSAYLRYKKKQEELKQKDERLETLEEKFEELSVTMKRMEELLIGLANGSK